MKKLFNDVEVSLRTQGAEPGLTTEYLGTLIIQAATL